MDTKHMEIGGALNLIIQKEYGHRCNWDSLAKVAIDAEQPKYQRKREENKL